MSYKVGDVVQLRAGGPLMTVHEVHSNHATPIVCTWFDKGHTAHYANYAAEALRAGDVTAPLPHLG